MKVWTLKITPFHLFLLTATAVLAAEAMIHMVLLLLPPMSDSLRNLVDFSGVLAVLGVTFTLAFRPLKDQWDRQVLTQEEIRANAERLQFALEGSQAGLWDWNILTGQTYFSPRWEEMLGYTPGEIKQCYQSWEDLLHPQDREETVMKLMDHVRGKTDYYEAEFRMQGKHGNWVWIHDRGKVVSWADNGAPLRAVGTHSDITEQKNVENEVKQLTRQLLITAEEERKKIASELHDEFGQTLVAIKLGLEILSDTEGKKPSDTQVQIERLIGLTTNLIQEMRDFSTNLRPTILDDMGFESALRWLIRQFENQIGEIHLAFEGFDTAKLPPEVEVNAYRLCQEGLNNIAKHAKASQARVEFKIKKEHCCIGIEDNGIGFDHQRLKNQSRSEVTRFGIIGMRERVQALGGSIEFQDVAPQGTRICINIPLKEPGDE